MIRRCVDRSNPTYRYIYYILLGTRTRTLEDRIPHSAPPLAIFRRFEETMPEAKLCLPFGSRDLPPTDETGGIGSIR